MPLKEDNVQEKQDNIGLTVKRIISAANRGDAEGVKQATAEAKRIIDTNYKDPNERKVKQEEFLRKVNSGIENEQNKAMFLTVAQGLGFVLEAIIAVSSFNDRVNHEQATARVMAGSNAVGTALLEMLYDCMKKEEEDKIKKALEEKIAELKELGVGKREEKPNTKAYDKFVKGIDEVLKDKIPVSVVSLVSFHASGGSNLTASKNQEFAKMDPA
jgi:hypothetical protein